MAYTTINKSTDHFNTKLYTGNATDNRAVTGVGFQPDLVWGKWRGGSGDHYLYDSAKGATKDIRSNANNAENTDANSLKSFDSDGFTLGTSDKLNGNTRTMVGWNWKAGGAGSANSDGSVSSTVSVNTTAGFSIAKYTGTGSNLTFGHGLGAIPDWFMIKNLSVGQAWRVYHRNLSITDPYSKRMVLSEDGGESSSALGLSQDPTSSLIYIDNSTGCTNASGENFICYAWIEKTGYSKFGSYTGNGSTDGTFIYTGFKPAWVMIKCTSHSGNNWVIVDNKREGFNPDNDRLYADSTSAESDTDVVDLLSNGFKNRFTGGTSNGTSKSYIYMAFGQSIVGSNNIPATAR